MVQAKGCSRRFLVSNRRSVSVIAARAAVLVTLLSALLAAPALAQPPSTTPVCHNPASPSRHILNLHGNGLEVHLGHGDYVVAAESCDGADNDCDGVADDGFGLGASCGSGACAGGVTECSADGTATRCSTELGGSDDRTSTELCDSIDNDCDGIADDGPDGDGDGVANICDNCPGLANDLQEDSDGACSDFDAESTEVADLGDACDNCDQVCNDQFDTRGIRAHVMSTGAPSIDPGDCVELVPFAEGRDLQLDDDELSRRFDLEDEDVDGTVEAGEGGSFTFTFFGKAIDGVVISPNGYVYLLGEGESGGSTGFETVIDAAPSAGTLPRYDGADFIVAAAWTDMLGSTEDRASTTDDPCISIQIIGSGPSSTQRMEITYEFVLMEADVAELHPLPAQIRLHETTNRIEIITQTQPDLQNVTRGVEGLFEWSSDPSVGAAFIAGDNNAATSRTNSVVEYFTSFIPENDPTLESGDACDNVSISSQCGDGFCYPKGGESSDFIDTSNYCPLDCFCGDGVCDTEGGEDIGNCPDCTGVCGDGLCEGPKGENLLVCEEDCAAFCGNGVCDGQFGENSENCFNDCG